MISSIFKTKQTPPPQKKKKKKVEMVQNRPARPPEYYILNSKKGETMEAVHSFKIRISSSRLHQEMPKRLWKKIPYFQI